MMLAASYTPVTWLAVGAAVTALVTGLVKVGRWVGTVETRLAEHEEALGRLDGAAEDGDGKES